MKRQDLPAVNTRMGKLRRLESAVKAIVHDGGNAFLHVRKGSDDLEVGILLDRKRILSLLLDAIEVEWAALREMGMEHSESEDPAVAGSIMEALHEEKE